MGCRIQFECLACHYSATVSGGIDAGEIIGTTTIYCETCRTLQDAVTSRLHEDGSCKEFPARCERSKKHPVRPWHQGEPCPRCGGTMRTGEEMILWD